MRKAGILLGTEVLGPGHPCGSICSLIGHDSDSNNEVLPWDGFLAPEMWGTHLLS